ncbi:hypothetical protein FA15DRAFT_724270 [Coprinopsis marcescibilis]|uniref:G domain-containing protein n=1 Tax=Coprinopsis marcescibilis TaxID=230819 RepID=A0A5C3KHM0_COPMA|nr:hypothetical protein FA15DRAFT_724270 [Coprinopsis marcescibilis]
MSIAKLYSILRAFWRGAQEGQAGDILIPIMGISGAGKSSFINAFKIAGGGSAKVGHTLQVCTHGIIMYSIRLPNELASEYKAVIKSRRIVLVDTPGFDTSAEDSDTLFKITEWLNKQYTKRATLGGVVYMCDISMNRINKAARVNVERLEKMLGGSNSFQRVVLVTAAWDAVKPEVGAKREEEFCLSFWRELIAGGAVVKRTRNLAGPAPSGHVEVLRHILQSLRT